MSPPSGGRRNCPYPELLAVNLHVCVPCSMEGITRQPGAAAAEYQRAHPGTVICQVEGTWHAWVPDGNGGAESHGRTEEELLAKLGG